MHILLRQCSFIGAVARWICSDFPNLRQISAFKAELGRRLDQFARKVAEIFDEGLLSSIKEGSRVAMRGSVNTASAWHGFHPSAYNAAARKGGINPNSRRGPIHWPKELSRPCCSDLFQMVLGAPLVLPRCFVRS